MWSVYYWDVEDLNSYLDWFFLFSSITVCIVVLYHYNWIFYAIRYSYFITKNIVLLYKIVDTILSPQRVHSWLLSPNGYRQQITTTRYIQPDNTCKMSYTSTFIGISAKTVIHSYSKIQKFKFVCILFTLGKNVVVG